MRAAGRVIIDLSKVDYVSSAGLLALDAAAGRMHTAAGLLVLCGLTEPVRLRPRTVGSPATLFC